MSLCRCLMGLLCAGVLTAAAAEDWPTFRHDNARTAITPEALAPPLVEQWRFTPRCGPEPAWTNPAKEKARVRFDEAFHAVAVGDALYFASSADNKVCCLDATTGEIRWSTITGGPIRVAPTLANGRVYVGSDDGCAYCLSAADGSLIWKTRAAWRDDRVLGNGKMISLWPIRTGVLVDDGVAYFGAGVFPHESIFICAVNADDGTLLWRNDTCGETGYKLEYGGISPQGPLLASADRLFVPSGRAMPAAFNRADGRFLFYASPGGKVGGTWALLTEDRLVAGVEAKRAFDQKSGGQAGDAAYAWFPGTHLVVAKDYAYLLNFEELVALDRRAFQAAAQWRSRIAEERKPLDNLMKVLKANERGASGEKLESVRAQIAVVAKQLDQLDQERRRVEEAVHRWRRPCALQDALTLAGDYLYMGGENAVAAALAKTGDDLWSAPVDGRACGIAIANGRLFVSTDTGAIHCFAKPPVEAPEVKDPPATTPFPENEFTALCARAADQIVAQSGVNKGFCLVYGSGTGCLAHELAKRTDMRIIAVDGDPQKVDAARQALDAAGVYGDRVTVDHADLADLPYADYFANLIVSETLLTSDEDPPSKTEFLRLLKPLGGVACLGRPDEAPLNPPLPDKANVDEWLRQQGAFTAELIDDNGRWVKVTRGPLPGAGKWTHLYADTANTACSDDELVRGPLGVLWFGRPGPERMVERHARAPAPAAMDGRLFVQGENVVMAYDSYNGVLLWEKAVPGALRVRVDSDMSNLALAQDGLYVATDDTCLRLDPATGETIRTYTIPPSADGKARRWGYLACVGDTLFGSTAKPLDSAYGMPWWEHKKGKTEQPPPAEAVTALLNEPQPTNPRDFWSYQQSGKMWNAMSPWPAWGSVASPTGAVTEKIMASDTLFALDTQTGALRWKYDGQAIAHPAIAIADGTVFLADCRVTEEQKQAAMAERQTLIEQGTWEKEDIASSPSHADVRLLIALDAASGETQWQRVIDLTGCGGDRMGLAYKDGVLCCFGCFSNHDRNLFKEGKLTWRRITALSGKDGADLWSRPLDYLRRPLIIGDTILIEPRACDLRTGAIKKRLHPITGQESTWEFVRPGHCCSISSASPHSLFLRGYFLWYYDLEKDQGMLPFGGIRPGCWINTIPANGLLLFPEASSGCTCSYPVRSTVVMKPEPRQRVWSFCVQHGDLTPVQRLAVNFGAPGDWRDDAGAMWFSYPHPPSTSWQTYGIDFDLKQEVAEGHSYFCRNFRAYDVKNTDKPWLFASGAQGLTRCVVPLLDEGQGPARYTVRLYFVEPTHTEPGKRVFNVKLQDQTVLSDLDVAAEAGGKDAALVKEFNGIDVDTGLTVELTPCNEEPSPDALPILSGIEVFREEMAVAKVPI